MMLRPFVPRALSLLSALSLGGRRSFAGVPFLGLCLAGVALGCQSSSQSRATPPPGYYSQGGQYSQQPYPQQYPQGQYPQGQYPQQQYPAQQYPQQPYPQQQYPQQPPPQQYPQQPPPAVSSTPLPPVPGDPISDVNLPWLRQQAQSILNDLVASLPEGSRARVQGIPLVVDDTPGEVNAFAACSNSRAAMAITDGLLEITAWLAQTAAADQVFGGNKTDEYIHFIATHLQQDKPIPRPTNLLTPAAQVDGRKVQRQHVWFDEQVAFVLGHELAHHHLGHLPCTGQPGLFGSGDLLRMLSQNVPLFNQPNESAADLAGTTNVLDAGRRRNLPWTEEGALLTMRFFQGLDGGFNLIVAFQQSHPAPSIRIPLIRQSASYWRSTGGQGIPVPRVGG